MTRQNDIDFLGDFRMVIDGRTEGSEKTIEVINPATEQPVGHAPDCSADQLDAAIASARQAFMSWKATPIAERQALLRAIADRIESIVEPLALLLTREQGKPLADARGEILRATQWFRFYAEQDLPVGRHTEPGGQEVTVRRVPLGVVRAIAPWNYPISMALWKLAPALLAGNAVVLKPSPFTPLTTLKLCEALIDILPPGLVNALSGGDNLGPWISEHPGIDKIAFTGSTATGRAVMRSSAANLKRLTLELGGNDPAIVLPDVDVEETAGKLFWAAFRNNGQLCVAAKRIYVHDSIYDDFAAAIGKIARSTAPAPGEQEGAVLGPVQNRIQYDKVRGLIAASRAAGLGFLSEPGSFDGPGFFIAPTIIDNPPEDARIVQEEPFGPVVPLLRYHDIDEVIRRANESEYGLAASVWAKDADLAEEVAVRIESGTVWINTAHILSPSIPFSGRKQSGIGVENGKEVLLEYTGIQAIIR
uniref:Non-acylating NAD-dependent aldehyde dehydrogenase n=1 Tax=Sphingopyxis macrogoltabida TaxID=33050 RepID=D9PTN3_SPHMC|nr:non-acylating NAD-dependent aldehyde dehydrogenase [Sphingopyxis macrogoltabida]